jgi:omega-hydroxy-beta-dihydromenaquinone-9 sulfotransferase
MIFVIGNSRSGTTMTGRILNRHSEVFTFNELHFFEQIWQESNANKKYELNEAVSLLNLLFSLQRDGYFFHFENPLYKAESEKILQSIGFPESKATSAEIFKFFLRYETNINNKKRSCEQTPRNVYYINNISTLYPEAKFIHIIRDPRDVMISQKNRWKRRKFNANKNNVTLFNTIRQWVNYHPITIMKLWQGANKVIEKNKNNTNFISVKYEDILLTPEKEWNRICSFLNLDFQPSMLLVPQIGSSLGKDTPERLGLDASKINGWKKGGLNKAEIYITEKMGAEIMKKHNYQLSRQKFTVGLIWSFFTFPIKLFVAILLSLKRLKNLPDVIKRRLK